MAGDGMMLRRNKRKWTGIVDVMRIWCVYKDERTASALASASESSSTSKITSSDSLYPIPACTEMTNLERSLHRSSCKVPQITSSSSGRTVTFRLGDLLELVVLLLSRKSR
jgi:hypothetical protein